MTSYQISLTPSKRVAGRFVTHVRRQIQKALLEEKRASGISQSEIARRIGVHRSVINRELNGRRDITLGRVAELAWAMGREVSFSLERPVVQPSANAPLAQPGGIFQQQQLTTFGETVIPSSGQRIVSTRT